MSRPALLLLALFLTNGCAVRSSSFSPLPVVVAENVPLHSAGLPESQVGCGWVVVQEKTVTRFMGMPLGSDVRQFEKSLFYCCPGESTPDPRCYQAVWYARGGE